MNGVVKSLVVAAVASLAPGLWAQQTATVTEEAQRKAYIDMMRKDIRKDKNAIVDEAMNLEAADKAKFWEVYTQYENEQKGLWDRRLENIKKYAENYKSMKDPVANDLAETSISIEQDTVALRKKYYEKMKAVLGPIIAARFLQVESMMGHLMGLQVGSEIPLIEQAK